MATIASVSDPQVGLQTSDNARFVRYWHEVPFSRISFNCVDNSDALKSKAKWFPMHKGGEFRKWYGNRELVVNWENDGSQIKEYVASRYPYLNGNVDYVVKDRGFFFREGITWSHTTVSYFSCRYIPAGSISNVEGPTIYFDGSLLMMCALLNSAPASYLLELLNPSFHYLVGVMRLLPVPSEVFLSQKKYEYERVAENAIKLSKADWDSFEISWDFESLSAIGRSNVSLRQSQETVDAECLHRFARLKELEEENNRLFIEAYGLNDELTPDVPHKQITLHLPDLADDIKRLLSYAIGCMMGRYSLDKPGLIYADSGNQDFDPSQYTTFQADDDGIIPLFETDWGIVDDAFNRILEFIGVTWPKLYLEENLKFIADSLGPYNGEQPRVTVRRYLATGFYKHHLSMYKKRPIYWLFSSGKKRAFQCLVYLHRYNQGTLARMRTEYVIPLQGQIAARIEQLEGDKTSATSTSHLRKLQKEQDVLKKQQVELLIFEEKLKHAADQKISLDLDDGVKLNYGKFGDLLAEAKTVTGGNDE